MFDATKGRVGFSEGDIVYNEPLPFHSAMPETPEEFERNEKKRKEYENPNDF